MTASRRLEIAQVEITKIGFNRVQLVRSTPIPLLLPQCLTAISQVLVEVSGRTLQR